MTLRMVVQCDGTPDDRPGMALERCRAYLPVEVDYLAPSMLIDSDAPVNRAYAKGWSQTPTGRDLCPSCTTAAALARLR